MTFSAIGCSLDNLDIFEELLRLFISTSTLFISSVLSLFAADPIGYGALNCWLITFLHWIRRKVFLLLFTDPFSFLEFSSSATFNLDLSLKMGSSKGGALQFSLRSS